jgi:hypothetical protein
MGKPVPDSLQTVFTELVEGAASDVCWVLNKKDAGLLRSLDALSASAASAMPASGGASIAAHVDHLRFGFSLMNRWIAGEQNPWANADGAASWQRTTVTDAEWTTLRQDLAREARGFLEVISAARDYSELELTGAIAIIAHLAYHFGAIRQIDRSIRGPAEG